MLLVNVYGCGFAGIVSAIGLCEYNNKVTGVDIDPSKIHSLITGHFPGNDQKIDSLILKHIGGQLNFKNFGSEIFDVDFSIVALPTPYDGKNLSLDGLKACCNHILQNRAPSRKPVILIRSTLPIGGLDQIERILESDNQLKSGEDFQLAYFPEFMREGTGLDDFTSPPLTVVGTNKGLLSPKILNAFGKKDFQQIKSKEAEALKLLCNAYHATKVTFANEAMRLCEKNGLSAETVMEVFCTDTKLNISKKYLKPGFAWGGGCLGKDTKALIAQEAKTPLLESLSQSNQIHVEFFAERILKTSPASIAFIGASFKENVNDVRDSSVTQLISLCNNSDAVRKVLVFDQNKDLPDILMGKEKVEFCTDYQLLHDVGVIVSWKSLPPDLKSQLRRDQICVELF